MFWIDQIYVLPTINLISKIRVEGDGWLGAKGRRENQTKSLEVSVEPQHHAEISRLILAVNTAGVWEKGGGVGAVRPFLPRLLLCGMVSATWLPGACCCRALHAHPQERRGG